VDVATDVDWGLNWLNVGFFEEEFFDTIADPFEFTFCEAFALFDFFNEFV